MNNRACLLLAAAIPAACAVENTAEDPQTTETQPTTATCTPNPLKNLYFGDLHTHTAYSLDAYGFGTREDPADAFLYARTQARPLDFTAITDHSEFLASAYGCQNSASPYYASTYCTDFRNQGSPAQAAILAAALSELTRISPQPPAFCRGANAANCTAQAAEAWQRIQDAANAANVPCQFSAFVAYEWTASTLGANLHRNVVFKNAAVPPRPYDAIDYPRATDLWSALDTGCTTSAGCDVLTIPHNSNASRGQMFQFDPADIPQMSRYQRLVEIFQHKGSSECISPTDPTDSGYDPQCNFELMPDRATSSDRPGYVRTALGEGLRTWQRRRQNPLQLGFVGALDTHNATPNENAENAFTGHLANNDDTPPERLGPNFRDFNPGGLTAVWAEENTRDSIFAAMKRRETYATSGPRMQVRFYQYWGTLDPCADPNFPASVLNAGGVPMGGVMTARAGQRPKFVVLALQDNLPIARVDIIKGSATALAATESIHVLPGSSGSRVCVSWEDPSYNSNRAAYYYARVLEDPSWRWSHYDCLADPNAAPDVCAECNADLSTCKNSGSLNYRVQETAWTSPIFQLP